MDGEGSNFERIYIYRSPFPTKGTSMEGVFRKSKPMLFPELVVFFVKALA